MHNKPVGCGASEAYAPGPDGEEEEGDLELEKHQSLFLVTCADRVYNSKTAF